MSSTISSRLVTIGNSTLPRTFRFNSLPEPEITLSPQQVLEIELRMLAVERAYERYGGVVQRLIKRLHASVVIDGKIVQERSFVQSLALKYIGILAPLWQSISRDYFECKKVQAKILAGGVNEKNGFLLHIKVFMDGDPAIGCLSEKNLLKKLSLTLSRCMRSALLQRI